MKQVITLLYDYLEKGEISDEKNKAFELLIKARSIDILKEKAEQGVGFAIEGLSRIASSQPFSYQTEVNKPEFRDE